MGVKLPYFFLAYRSSFYEHRQVYSFLLVLTILDLCLTCSQYGFPCIVATPNGANIPFFCGFLCCHIFKHTCPPIAYGIEYSCWGELIQSLKYELFKTSPKRKTAELLPSAAMLPCLCVYDFFVHNLPCTCPYVVEPSRPF